MVWTQIRRDVLWHSVNLGPNCLHMLSAHDKSPLARKELCSSVSSLIQSDAVLRLWLIFPSLDFSKSETAPRRSLKMT